MIHLATLLASTPTTTVATAHRSSGSLLDPIAKPIAWLLAEIYAVIPNYGVAIMVLSVIWMLIISPLTLKSTRSMLAMQKLQPQLKKLQEQHRNDRQAFAQAQMELFREHQVSPFGSCLPMLLPLPIFFALFRVIDGLSHTVKGPNAALNCTTSVCSDPKYLNHSTQMFKDIVAANGQIHAFGMNLAQNALSHHGSFLAAIPFWITLLIMAGTSYFQSAQMMSRNKAALAQNPQMKLMKYLPLIFVVVCVRFPIGVIIYYATSNLCRIVQQDFMYRFDPKVKALVAQEVVEVEELTQEIDDQDKGSKGKATTSKPPPAATPSKANAPSSGRRSRFGDLLAAAAEQQAKKTDTKSAPKDNGKSSSAGQTQPGAKSQPGGKSQPSGQAQPAAKSQPAGTANGNGNTNGNGSASTGNGSTKGASGPPRRQPQPGGRTNRKRRRK
jgi:YidC/Oxa1 family membrane protein insertase